MIETIYEGWRWYQGTLIEALMRLDEQQLDLRAAQDQRSVRELATHIVRVRAIWTRSMNQEGGEVMRAYARWENDDAPARTKQELIKGIEHTWDILHDAIARWTPEEWKDTWPGHEDGDEPETVTRHFVIWHLIEHDIYHGGEISSALGVHGLEGLDLGRQMQE